MIPEPTIQDMIDAAAKAVRGMGDKNADFVRGSDYEALIGPSAIIWYREAQRDTDLFNAINFNTADGDDLTELALRRYGKVRVLDSRGTGTAVLARPASGVAETIWAGTRFMIPGPQARFYRTTRNVAVGVEDLTVRLPIEALEIGPGVAVNVGDNGAVIADVLKDSTWRVFMMSCTDGTLFEKAEDFRARIRRERLEARVGQVKRIIQACADAGAPNVAIFRSDYAGDAYDAGLNYVYVGDPGNNGTPELVKACTLALQKVRVAGDSLQVLPMTRGTLDVSADIYLYDSPVLFDIPRLERLHGAAILQYLNGTSGRLTYSLDGLRGAIARNTPEVQRVVLATPSADQQIVSGPRKNFPAVLTRYVPGNIALRYHGP